MRFLITLVVTVVLMTVVSAQLKHDKAPSIKLFKETNEFRKKNGKKALKWDDNLYKIALDHNTYMHKAGKASHDGFDKRSKKGEKFGLFAMGENAAGNSFGKDPPSKLTTQFINSPTHKKNMLSNKTFMGQAFSRDGNKKYTTQLYAIKKDGKT